MSNIAFLGLGAMGSRMAAKLIEAGHAVTVWNRNSALASPLVALGAIQSETPCAAAREADFVISMLRDNEASQSVWCNPINGAILGLKANAIAIECSTLSVEWVRALSQTCADKNIVFLDAPVAGSRPQAEASQLIFFVGGEKQSFEKALPIFNLMGSTSHYAGLSGAGASIKLAVNSLFGIQLSTIAELIGLFNVTGIDANQAIDIITSTPVCSPATKLAARAMLAKSFSPMFPIELVRKDFSYAVATAQAYGTELPLTHAAENIFQTAIKKGFGEDNITGISQLYNSH